MPKLPNEVLAALDNTYGPVALTFTVTQVPVGAAPDFIKERWVGVTLPVRARNLGVAATRYFDLQSGTHVLNEEPVSVAGVEAVQALHDAGERKAATYWAMFGVELDVLTFRASEGEFHELDQ
jgi:hypothetical protein